MSLGLAGIGALSLQLAGAGAASEAAFKAARSAQERFEITRRAHLPRLHSFGGRQCDVIVGRYCYWYDSTETRPVPEPRRIVEARKALLRLLDSLAADHPEQDWIAGQRIRYVLESGDAPAALKAAQSCAATRWWCAALEGLTHHVAERYLSADSAFARALQDMPADQRCDWMNLQRLVMPPLSREFGKVSCDRMAERAHRLFGVSQPLWSVMGNDLRTEVFARHTMALLLARSANGHGMAWSHDSRELLLRYGWAEWYSRAEPTLYQTTAGGITGHEREPSYYVFPRVPSTRSRIAENSWALRDATMPMRYAPRHVEWMGELAHQLVRLPRGDSLLLVAVARVSDSALASDSVTLTLGALRDTTIVRTGTVPLMLDLPNDSMVVSVEALGSGTRRAERARYSIAPLPCTRRCLSDLLLFRADGDSVGSLRTVIGRGLPGIRVAATEALGVYWETGEGPLATAPRDSVVWASVVVEPARIGTVRRAAARLRLAAAPSAVKLRWRMTLARSGHVVLRLPSNARGRYNVRLTIDDVGGAERPVIIE